MMAFRAQSAADRARSADEITLLRAELQAKAKSTHSTSDHIKRPDSFSGLFDNNALPASQFLELYQGWVDMAYPNDPQAPAKYFLSCLKVSAAQWYLREVKGKPTADSWPDLKTFFLDEYNITDPDGLEGAYIHRYQKPGEKVVTYADDITMMFNRYNLGQADRLQFFCKNLLPTIITDLSSRKPKTMADAVKCAVAIEKSQLATITVAGIAKDQTQTLIDASLATHKTEMNADRQALKALLASASASIAAQHTTMAPLQSQEHLQPSVPHTAPMAESLAPYLVQKPLVHEPSSQSRGRGRGRNNNRSNQSSQKSTDSSGGAAKEEPVNIYKWRHGQPPQWFTDWLQTQNNLSTKHPSQPPMPPVPSLTNTQQQPSSQHSWPTRTQSPGGRFYDRAPQENTQRWGGN
jgi:hypothetical protein